MHVTDAGVFGWLSVGVCFDFDPSVEEVELGSSAKFLPLRRSSSSSPLLDNSPSNFPKRLQAYHWPRVVLHTSYRQ